MHTGEAELSVEVSVPTRQFNLSRRNDGLGSSSRILPLLLHFPLLAAVASTRIATTPKTFSGSSRLRQRLRLPSSSSASTLSQRRRRRQLQALAGFAPPPPHLHNIPANLRRGGGRGTSTDHPPNCIFVPNHHQRRHLTPVEPSLLRLRLLRTSDDLRGITSTMSGNNNNPYKRSGGATTTPSNPYSRGMASSNNNPYLNRGGGVGRGGNAPGESPMMGNPYAAPSPSAPTDGTPTNVNVNPYRKGAVGVGVNPYSNKTPQQQQQPHHGTSIGGGKHINVNGSGRVNPYACSSSSSSSSSSGAGANKRFKAENGNGDPTTASSSSSTFPPVNPPAINASAAVAKSNATAPLVSPSPAAAASSSSSSSSFGFHNHHGEATSDSGGNDIGGISHENDHDVVVDEALEEGLRTTLESHYGFDSFRPGQLAVTSALLSDRDASVFWATGRGKSLCYQLPALHTKKTAVVVSPLISLMQDQCDKINGLLDRQVACYLGSGQMDQTVDRRALDDGEFLLVYLTPEKLSSEYVLDKLERMARINKLCLLAVDEAHCVSEWGHDFRPSYRQLSTVRDPSASRPALASVPIVTLTATAVPRVREDIFRQLRLRRPGTLVDVQSLDRENLRIEVHRKPSSGGFAKALLPFVEETKRSASRGSNGGGGGTGGRSTIIYAPTKSLVEEISNWLFTQFADTPAVRVAPYHAGLSNVQRQEAHTGFLTGSIDIVVATIAFGMGIDKPDVRRVMHYGAPKTVEEYYQQIGRAGRDGLTARCVMWANEHDFTRYGSEFYTAGIKTEEARRAVERSTDSLRKYAMDSTGCRRLTLLDFFGQDDGKRCGTCDNCLNGARYGDDAVRDLGPQARVVLLACAALKDQGLSIVEKVMGGTVVESWRYVGKLNPERVKRLIKLAKEASLPRRYRINFYKELVPPLVQRGYLTQGKKTGGVKFKTTWTTYRVSDKGLDALAATPNTPKARIDLPVPPALRAIEQEEEAKRKATLAKLESSGVDLTQVPKSELEAGDGEVLRAHKHWIGHLDSLRRLGKTERIEQLEDLLRRIERWRSDAAVKYRMAPASVMAEHLLVKVAYASASRGGATMEAEALHAAGVRTAGVGDLVAVLANWREETAGVVAEHESEDGEPSPSASPQPMTFPEGDDAPFAPDKPWALAVYKPNKKTGKAAWESSHARFLRGDHPQTIAINPENGRTIAVGTVVGHCMEGLVQGRPVPLGRLAAVSTPPNEAEWETLRQIEETGGEAMDLTKNIVAMSEFLRPIMGDEFIDTPYQERNESDAAKYRKWCELLKWYQSLRRVGYRPTFGSTKRE